MIIDLSYFRGQILIAKLDDANVQDQVNAFITQFELEYLRKMLGYTLATQFIAGLQEPVIEQRWVDLLVGADYGTGQHWNGFANTLIYPTVGTNNSGFVWIVGTAGSPAPDSTSFTDSRLVNRAFFIERRGFGTMLREGDTGVTDPDYSFESGTVTLLKTDDLFHPNEVFILHVTGYTSIPNNNSVNLSPIAYYVWYKWAENLVSESTSLGERRSSTENSQSVPPLYKQVTAWNNMVDLNRDLVGYLNANSATYGFLDGWDRCYANELTQRINTFGI